MPFSFVFLSQSCDSTGRRQSRIWKFSCNACYKLIESRSKNPMNAIQTFGNDCFYTTISTLFWTISFRKFWRAVYTMELGEKPVFFQIFIKYSKSLFSQLFNTFRWVLYSRNISDSTFFFTFLYYNFYIFIEPIGRLFMNECVCITLQCGQLEKIIREIWT